MVWINAAVPELMMLGTVPANPAIRLVTPPPDRAPCTCRKSTALAVRQETRCAAMDAPLA